MVMFIVCTVAIMAALAGFAERLETFCNGFLVASGDSCRKAGRCGFGILHRFAELIRLFPYQGQRMGVVHARSGWEQRTDFGTNCSNCISVRPHLIPLIDLPSEKQKERVRMAAQRFHDGVPVIESVLGRGIRNCRGCDRVARDQSQCKGCGFQLHR